ncbi:hypothetical protein D918_08006 [Trichuris suis]|nr:hypothetical protein D918_08006 [Trichuris suis]
MTKVGLLSEKNAANTITLVSCVLAAALYGFICSKRSNIYKLRNGLSQSFGLRHILPRTVWQHFQSSSQSVSLWQRSRAPIIVVTGLLGHFPSRYMPK